MSDGTFNKIAGAVCGTGLLVLVLQNAGGAIFHPVPPSEEKPGFKIEVAEAAEAAGGAEAAAVPLPEPLGPSMVMTGAMFFTTEPLVQHGYRPARTAPGSWGTTWRRWHSHG